MYICTKEKRQLNLPFGDQIATVKEDNHSRILFQNVKSFEMSTEQLTLENTCDVISRYEIDIASLTETNTNWKHPGGASTLRQASKRHCKHHHFIISETDISWKALYKPGGTTIITQQPLFNGITNYGQDPHGFCRWSFITISGQEKSIIIIISAYRICDT